VRKDNFMPYQASLDSSEPFAPYNPPDKSVSVARSERMEDKVEDKNESYRK
jgi:hypothetical protein